MGPLQVLPTVGLNIARFNAYGFPLVFWDLGGQAGLRSIWDKYYGECHALMYVVDASDRGRLEEAKGCLDRALGEQLVGEDGEGRAVGRGASWSRKRALFGLGQRGKLCSCVWLG